MASRVVYLEVKKLFLQVGRSASFQPRNPPDPHFDKKLMLEVCKPIYDPPKQPAWETCEHNVVLPQAVDPHPYEKMLCEELKKNWEASRMVCFFHVNPMSMEEERRVKVLFKKKDMFLHLYKESVAKLALYATRYEPCLHVFKSRSALLFSAEPKAAEVLKISKKTNHVVLLAGIIDDVFYSKTQLQEYSKLPGIEVLHQNLVGLIQSKVSEVTRSLNQPTQLLSLSLKQHSSPET